MGRLHVLGSGGWVPTPQRQTCCYLFEGRSTLIIFDCGTGLSRLHDPAFQLMLRRHTRALVLLSHWHHDHIEGLHYLPFFLKDLEVVLGVPGRSICRKDPRKLLARFTGVPFLPTPMEKWGDRFPRGFRVEEIGPGRNEILGEEVVATVQPHVGPTVGYRVRDVAYVTDTCVREETVALAEEAAVLIHDAYLDDEGAEQDPEAAKVHGVGTGAARLAGQARVGDLVLGHLNPGYDVHRLDRMLLSACEVFRRTVLGSDMMVMNVKVPGEPEEPGEERNPAEELTREPRAEAPVQEEEAAGDLRRVEAEALPESEGSVGNRSGDGQAKA